MRATTSLVLVQPYLHSASNSFLSASFSREADQTLHGLAALDAQQRRDGLDLELHGQIALVIDVDLAEFHAGNLRLQRFHHGRKHHARAAPACPEIHHNGRFGLHDFLFKVIQCYDRHIRVTSLFFH